MTTKLEVTTKQGKLRGALVHGVLGDTYIAFRGIPYAAPPLGSLRFKDPEPPIGWTGIRDASKPANVCIQYNKYPPNDIIGDEDCLYLNIYTSSLMEIQPVMFWIHGGGFINGTGNETATRSDYLCRKGIMVVSINYRLGPFGFFNLDDEIASGNQGLKDSIMALKWVRDNIVNFGGDPKNVTISGNSAAGVLVHLLTLSPIAKGLFNRAIIQSGVANNSWGLAKPKSYPGYELARSLGNNSKDPRNVVEFLQTIPAVKIIETFTKLSASQFSSFLPNIDHMAKISILPRPIEELNENQLNVPYMIGHTSAEFLMLLKDWSDGSLKKYDADFEHYINTLSNIDTDDKLKNLCKELRERYNLKSPFGRESIPSLVQCFSDLYFVNGINEVVEDRRQNNCAPTFFYKISYICDALTSTKLSVGTSPISGTSHADEMPFIFYLERGKDQPSFATTRDRITMERFTTLWTNYIKTGNPTCLLDEYVTTNWKPVNEHEYNCLYIDEELKLSTYKHEMAEIYKRYN